MSKLRLTPPKPPLPLRELELDPDDTEREELLEVVLRDVVEETVPRDVDTDDDEPRLLLMLLLVVRLEDDVPRLM